MSGFIRREENGIIFYRAENLEGLSHLFTTRHGGVSSGENFSLNLGINKDENKDNTIENFRRVCAVLDLDSDDVFVLKQIHTDNVHELSAGDKSLFYNTEDRVRGDGIVSNIKGSGFGVFTADCVPVILYDRKKNTAAAIHSGWRSAAMHIVKKAAGLMIEKYGCAPNDIAAAIGPSIRKCCFEVDIDAAEKFDEIYREKKGSKFHIDLQRVITDDLHSMGIYNIADSKLCTVCCSDEFFSSRAQKGKHGLMMAVAKINS